MHARHERHRDDVLAGRILFGGFFIFNGANHFLNTEQTAAGAAAAGVPAPVLAALLTGVLLLVGGVSVLVGLLPRLGLSLLLLFFLGVTFVMHDFWNVTDPQQQMLQMQFFLRNVALTGAVLMLAAIPTPWPMSVDEHYRHPTRRGTFFRGLRPRKKLHQKAPS